MSNFERRSSIMYFLSATALAFDSRSIIGGFINQPICGVIAWSLSGILGCYISMLPQKALLSSCLYIKLSSIYRRKRRKPETKNWHLSKKSIRIWQYRKNLYHAPLKSYRYGEIPCQHRESTWR